MHRNPPPCQPAAPVQHRNGHQRQYLRGQRFTACASLLRSGNKVAVVRSELFNEEGLLVAVGTGTYLCG